MLPCFRDEYCNVTLCSPVSGMKSAMSSLVSGINIAMCTCAALFQGWIVHCSLVSEMNSAMCCLDSWMKSAMCCIVSGMNPWFSNESRNCTQGWIWILGLHCKVYLVYIILDEYEYWIVELASTFYKVHFYGIHCRQGWLWILGLHCIVYILDEYEYWSLHLYKVHIVWGTFQGCI